MNRKELRNKLWLSHSGSCKIKILRIIRDKEAQVVLVLYRRKSHLHIEWRCAGFPLEPSRHGGWDLITRFESRNKK